MPLDKQEHINFLNNYYSKVYQFYDLTRKYYLLGRDALLSEIVRQNPKIILEIGCGTGRNLSILHRKLPNAMFGAVEPCDFMREYAQKKYPWIVIKNEFAEDADLTGIFQEKPDAIFISYSLSMISQKEKTIENCLRALGSQGKLYIVDFGDLQGLGWLGQKIFMQWLHWFHVYPETLDSIWTKADRVLAGPLSYWKRAVFTVGDKS
ncbi:MAG: class I SAM-dependent methyltransferase [Spirulina sp.]